PLPQSRCSGLKFGIRKCLQSCFKSVDLFNQLAHTFQFTAVFAAKKLAKEITNHGIIVIRKTKIGGTGPKCLRLLITRNDDKRLTEKIIAGCDGYRRLDRRYDRFYKLQNAHE